MVQFWPYKVYDGKTAANFLTAKQNWCPTFLLQNDNGLKCVKRVTFENMCDLSHTAQELKTLMRATIISSSTFSPAPSFDFQTYYSTINLSALRL